MVTPLARELFNSSLKNQQWSVVDDLQESHFFEVSEIYNICNEFATKIHRTGLSNDNFFLPAPKTWIEFRPYPDDKEYPKLRQLRVGYFITEDNNTFTVKAVDSTGWLGSFLISKDEYVPLKDDVYRRQVLKELEQKPLEIEVLKDSRLILFLLTMINQPRLIGRRQHMPDQKLERRLLQMRPNIGKFPLQAWTEITLSVSAPTKDVSGKASQEAHLTGVKPLHFCRQHWRVRLGRLERVKAHWRGDPSLGIKRSRYKVTP